jgi:hypothetical protein
MTDTVFFIAAVFAPLVKRCGNSHTAISIRDRVTFPNRYSFNSCAFQFISNTTLNLSKFHMFTLYNHQSVAHVSQQPTLPFLNGMQLTCTAWVAGYWSRQETVSFPHLKPLPRSTGNSRVRNCISFNCIYSPSHGFPLPNSLHNIF